MRTLRASLDTKKAKATLKDNTFGAMYNDRQVVPGSSQHYYGRGNVNTGGMG